MAETLITNCALKLDDIKGSITADDSDFKEQIAVLSWSWGATQAATAGTASGTTHVHEVTISKYLDASSPTLFSYCCLGNNKTIKNATLSFRTSSKNIVLKIVMTNAVITSYSIGGGGSGHPTETVTLSFEKVEFVHKSFKADGGAGPENTKKWNLKANKEG